MTIQRHPDAPDFFDPDAIDPVASASGGDSIKTGGKRGRPSSAVPKRKAGFYLSEQILNRFDRKFYELKLAGHPVGNKSALIEAALTYALNDLDRNEASTILKSI